MKPISYCSLIFLLSKYVLISSFEPSHLKISSLEDRELEWDSSFSLCLFCKQACTQAVTYFRRAPFRGNRKWLPP